MTFSKLVLASNNRGKLAELFPLFSPLGFELVAQSALGVAEAEEPFKTFVENALAKARNAAAHTGLPAVADDAGLCVAAWGGEPGVDTAYFATRFGYEKSDANNVRAVLEQLGDSPNRKAALVSTLVAVRRADDPEPLIAVGRASGELLREPRGAGGFGFDPVLWMPELNATFAEVSADVKNLHSHRGKAARKLVSLIQDAWT
jgi:XTP/dITP diphosphohydrolase